jgi:hypothetical protein
VPKALRISYRFLGIIFVSSAFAVIAIVAARWWMSWLPAGRDLGTGVLVVLPFFAWFVISFCFAIAALGWAAWGLRGKTGHARRQAWLAVALSAGTATIFGVVWSVMSRTP